jgi:hypothetical protein
MGGKAKKAVRHKEKNQVALELPDISYLNNESLKNLHGIRKNTLGR